MIVKRYSIDDVGNEIIKIGIQGENRTREIVFDVTGWMREYPDGGIVAAIKTPSGSIQATIVERNGNELVWPITGVETAETGVGTLEITLIDGDRIAKSRNASYIVNSSLTADKTPAPTPEYETPVGIPYSNQDPLPDGVASPGISSEVARADHVHPVKGGDGKPGKDGTTYTPHVSEDGILSWTNDADLPNPEPVNIRGEKGESGIATPANGLFTIGGDDEGNLYAYYNVSNEPPSFDTDESGNIYYVINEQ